MRKFKYKLISLLSAMFFLMTFVMSACDKIEEPQTPKLPVPQGVEIIDSVLVWDAVDGADDWYIVKINETEYDAYSNSYALDFLNAAGIYTISVKAVGQGEYADSDWSASVVHTVKQRLSAPSPVISGSFVTWSKINNANKYIVSLNDDEIQTDKTYFDLSDIEGAGSYSIKIQAISDSAIFEPSAWSTPRSFKLAVITFDTNGGEELGQVVLQVGSQLKLPVPEGPTDGDVFMGWFEDALCTKPFTASQMGESNITLYAQWATNIDAVFTFVLNASQDAYSVSKLKTYGKTLSEIEIPESYNEKPVTAIASNAFTNEKFTSVSIPESVTVIGNNAFSMCANLSNIVFEGDSALSEIRAGAFNACKELKVFDLPDTVEKIGSNAFYQTGIFATVTNNIFKIKDWAVGYHGKIGNASGQLNIGNADGIKKIADSAFSGLDIVELAVGDDMVYIGDSAFSSSRELETVVIGNNLTAINTRTFNQCPALSSITFGSKIASIGDYAFQRSALTAITLPDSVKSIGAYAFDYCESLTDVTLGAELESIGDYAFNYCGKISQLTFTGTALTSIGNYAFKMTRVLENVALSEGVTVIGQEAFSYSGVKTVALPASLITIGQSAFTTCVSLETVTIAPDSELKEIGITAFANCSRLTEIILPASLGRNITEDEIAAKKYRVGIGAFANCTVLVVYVKSDIVPTMLDSFGQALNPSIKAIFVPTARLSAYQKDWESFASIIYAEGEIVNGMVLTSVYNSGNIEIGKRLAVYIGNDVELTLNNVIEIAPKVFSRNKTLKKITLGSSVKTIGSNAFAACSALEEVIIADNGVTTIEGSAFLDCTALKTVAFGNALTFIGITAFLNCIKLNNIVLPDSLDTISARAFSSCTTLSRVNLGNGVRVISEYAFSSSFNITRIEIPSSVETIGASIFDGARPVVFFSDDAVPPEVAGGWGSGLKAIIVADSLVQTFRDKWPSTASKILGTSAIFDNKFIIAPTTNNESTLIAYFGTDSFVQVPASVKRIAPYAFTGCPELQIVNIPNTVTTVERHAFAGWGDNITIYVEFEFDNVPRWDYPNGWNVLWYYTSESSAPDPSPIIIYGDQYVQP